MATRTKSKDTDAKPQASQGYTVLARRYRSRDFDELIGQEPIARTLMNAIKTGRTAHAYLFCGTRGVGKTSMARIFAKALNATDDLKEKQAVGDAILRGDDLDVIEIDGASNRGINEARDLIAGAGLSPARSPYKIYIIDEVHMLTREAFNALLKTMEEPPAHVKFILCTTEPHKVPATIQSRCQRFDFRAIPSSRISEQLRRILKDEGVKADDAVVARVAQLGNGSMRDALSVLDRLLAGGQDVLTVALLEEMLGLPDHTLVERLVEAIVAGDARRALEGCAELLAGGATVDQAFELLTDRFRTLMIIVACGEDCDFLEAPPDSVEAARRQAAHFDAAGLVHMIALCDAGARNSRGSTSARALLEAAIVRLCMSERFADIPALLAGTRSPDASAPRLPARAADAADSKKKEPPLRPLLKVPEGDVGLIASQAALSPEPSPEAPPSAPSIAELKPAPRVESLTNGMPSLDALWRQVVAAARPIVQDYAKIEHLEPVALDGTTLRLAITPDGAGVARVLQNSIEKIADLVRRSTGHALRVELDGSRVGSSPPDAADPAMLQGAAREPAVEKARELFDAVLVSVEPLRSDG